MQELTAFPKPNLSPEVKELLTKATGNGNGNSNGNSAYPAKSNPSLQGNPQKKPSQNLRKAQVAGARYPCLPTELTGRYYGRVDDFTWPPEVRAYNNNFTKALSTIKRRHDPVVTTMGNESILLDILLFSSRNPRIQETSSTLSNRFPDPILLGQILHVPYWHTYAHWTTHRFKQRARAKGLRRHNLHEDKCPSAGTGSHRQRSFHLRRLLWIV
jgi:hypothetical protein